MTWPTLPQDVVDWVRKVIGYSNDHVTERIVNQPNIREVSLDDALINKIAQYSAPKRLASGAVVMLEVHNIGGLRHFYRWELADIAFLIHVSLRGEPLEQKIGLLQSKRLYPENFDVDQRDPIRFMEGMNGLLQPFDRNTLSAFARKYEFTSKSTYGAIKQSDEQLERIIDFHDKFDNAVYYLLYNPSVIPFETEIPNAAYDVIASPEEGARVVTVETIAKSISQKTIGFRGPNLKSIKKIANKDYWRLETWVADLLLGCKVGRRYTKEDEELVGSLLVRRSGPISAAIRINIDLADFKGLD